MDYIRRMLLDLGISPELRGYTYLRMAVELCAEDDTYKQYLTSSLYPKIARECYTNKDSVERCMRHAIDVSFKHMPESMKHSYFGNVCNPDTGMVTVGTFVAVLTEHYIVYKNGGSLK